jgi:hypothetical protein
VEKYISIYMYICVHMYVCMYVCMYAYRLGISRIAYALSLSLIPRISKAAVHIKLVLHTLHWYFISLSFVLSVELHIAHITSEETG